MASLRRLYRAELRWVRYIEHTGYRKTPPGVIRNLQRIGRELDRRELWARR